MVFTLSEIFLWKICGELIGVLLFLYSLDKATKATDRRVVIFWFLFTLIGALLVVIMLASIIYVPDPISEVRLNCINSVIHQNLSVSTEEAARMCTP